jgi:hypothetical protein
MYSYSTVQCVGWEMKGRKEGREARGRGVQRERSGVE